MLASENGDLEMARLLLEAGADKDLQDSRGNTAFMLAAKNGHVKVARLLLEAGADKDLWDSFGRTALARGSTWPCGDGQAAFESWC